jgi:hypothetical protein
MFKYSVVKKIIDPEFAQFLYQYLDLKVNAVKWLYNNKILPPTDYLGKFADGQIRGNHYAHYADFAMETLLLHIMPKLEKKLKRKLIPTYSYVRVYYKGSEMYRHKDRTSCEISITLNLGGTIWPIYIDPTGERGVIKDGDPKVGMPPLLKKGAHKGTPIKLAQGDCMLYEGDKYEHWRKPLKSGKCGQVFLHYNYADGQYGSQNLNDRRPLLGLRKNIDDR